MSGLSCAQTPPRFSDTATITNTPLSNAFGNAGLRLSALVPGTGLLTNPGTSGGIGVDENIQNTLTHNGVPYTFNEMRFFYGAHEIFKWNDIKTQALDPKLNPGTTYTAAPLEAYIFFKNTSNKTICLVLPIGIDKTKTGVGGAVTTNASIYINALTTTAGTTPPLLTQLFQDLSGSIPSFSFNAANAILTYNGQDVRLLSSCSPTSTAYPITYFVIMNDPGTKLFNSTITLSDLDALIGKVKNPIMTFKAITNTINTSLTDTSKIDMYPSATTGTKGMFTVSVAGKGNRTISTNALKCYTIDPTKNIRDNTLTLDENGKPTTLADQLDVSVSKSSTPSLAWGGWLTSVAGIEAIIAIITTSLVICISVGMYMYYMKRSAAPPTLGATGPKNPLEWIRSAPAGPIATTTSSYISSILSWFRSNAIFWIISGLVAVIVGLVCVILYLAGVIPNFAGKIPTNS